MNRRDCAIFHKVGGHHRRDEGVSPNWGVGIETARLLTRGMALLSRGMAF